MIEPISLVSLLFFQYSTSIESLYLTQQEFSLPPFCCNYRFTCLVSANELILIQRNSKTQLCIYIHTCSYRYTIPINNKWYNYNFAVELCAF